MDIWPELYGRRRAGRLQQPGGGAPVGGRQEEEARDAEKEHTEKAEPE